MKRHINFDSGHFNARGSGQFVSIMYTWLPLGGSFQSNWEKQWTDRWASWPVIMAIITLITIIIPFKWFKVN